MAKVPPPEHTRFKKGVSGNPGGFPKVRIELHAIKPFTTQELKAVITKHLYMPMPGLAKVVDSTTAPAIDIIIAKTFITAVEKGEYSRIQPLIDRVCGRLVDAPTEERKGPSTEHLDNLSDEELEAIAKRS